MNLVTMQFSPASRGAPSFLGANILLSTLFSYTLKASTSECQQSCCGLLIIGFSTTELCLIFFLFISGLWKTKLIWDILSGSKAYLRHFVGSQSLFETFCRELNLIWDVLSRTKAYLRYFVGSQSLLRYFVGNQSLFETFCLEPKLVWDILSGTRAYLRYFAGSLPSSLTLPVSVSLHVYTIYSVQLQNVVQYSVHTYQLIASGEC
jgi:hypothetical protein